MYNRKKHQKWNDNNFAFLPCKLSSRFDYCCRNSDLLQVAAKHKDWDSCNWPANICSCSQYFGIIPIFVALNTIIGNYHAPNSESYKSADIEKDDYKDDTTCASLDESK